MTKVKNSNETICVIFKQYASFGISWSSSVTRQVNFNKTKIGEKCQNIKNSNETLGLIFKQCAQKLPVHPVFDLQSMKLL